MRPLLHLLQTALNDRDELESISAGFVDDASRLNRTQVAEIRSISRSHENLEEQLCAYLKHARARKLPLSIAGTRHTMGGQTFTPGGIILDMLGLHEMQLDEQMTVLRVQAGARWSNVLSYVHERGCSIKVMQSNNSFSVGGSLSANCHGWQPMSSPISSTVVAFRFLLADGTLVRCSREGHAELFSLALGGSVGSAYGKALRWDLEKRFGQIPLGSGITRNHLLNEGVEVFQNRSAASTDILQEYFVPTIRLEPFLEQVRTIIPSHRADLLNVTIRFIAPDQESFLRYADQNELYRKYSAKSRA
jgi:hypothetical protein